MAAGFGQFEVLLLDIEGTVCPISFVKELLFPYALDSLPKTLDEQWDSPSFAQYRDAFPDDYRHDRPALEAHVRDLVSRDVKAPYLKALQGYLWEEGYKSGELKAPLFSDVPPFMTASHDAGTKVMIYSSGSVAAQKLLFGHTNAQPPNLCPLISNWFDTVNAGPKADVASYKIILSMYPDISPARWLFLSDNLKEVDAALESGMQSLPVARPGNAPLPPDHRLSSLALPDFTPESAERGRASMSRVSKSSRAKGRQSGKGGTKAKKSKTAPTPSDKGARNGTHRYSLRR